MNDRLLRNGLRAAAIAIAVVAVIDPNVSVSRAERPVVVINTLDSLRDAPLVERLSKSLKKTFDVSRVSVAGASAAILVGDRPPAPNTELPMPAFALLSDTMVPSVSIERIDLPASVPSDSRVPISTRIVVHGAMGRSLDATLSVGSLSVDRVTRRLGRADTTLSIPLSFVPTSLGAAVLRVTATLGGGGTVTVDAVTDVHDQRWPVLFYDPRPSWTSTFVRRAIEHDPRFVVTSRVETSRNVSTDAGRPPARLDDIASLSDWGVIVIGAPEGLSVTDVAGLDVFMRRRGGTVVFLLDQRVAAPYDRLIGAANWTSRSATSASLVSARHDSATLRAGEIAFPSTLPAGATTIAGGVQPVVWETSVGGGHLIVSGALDAWRFRDPSSSGFDIFWKQTLAEAANTAPAAVTISTSHAVANPGEWVGVHAIVRNAAMAPPFSDVRDARSVRASVAAHLERVRRGESDVPSSDSGQPITTLRLFPAAALGEFSGRFRAPSAGTYRVVASSGGALAEAPVIVAPSVQGPRSSARDLVDAWAHAHGGRAFQATEITALSSALTDAVRPPVRLENWHPMRSAWWMIPFALALSAEWLLRRRRGLR